MTPRHLVLLLVLSLPCLPAVRAADPKADYLGALVAEGTYNGLMEKIRTKVAAGSTSAGALAPEIKELDESIRLFSDEKNVAGRFAFLKAMLHADVIRDLPRARELLRGVKSDYAGTEYAGHADQALAAIARTEKREAAQADLQPVVDQIMAKAGAGSHDPAAFEPEIAKLDALVKKYSANPEAAANIAFVKAMVHVKALNQLAKGRELLLALVAKYPDTDVANAAKQTIALLESADSQPPAKPGA